MYPRVMLLKIAAATANLRSLTILSLCSQSTNFLGTLFLVGYLQLGAIGSALATFATALLFQPLVIWPFGLKFLGLSWSRYVRDTLIRGLTPAVSAAVMGEVLRQQFHPAEWLGLCSSVLVVSVTYAALLVLCLAPEDRRDLSQAMQNTWPISMAFGKQMVDNR